MFKQDSTIINILTKIGNMIMVSFYFLITCIPVFTIIPAYAALFHTTTKVIRRNGDGVTRDYFFTFWKSLKPGVILSLICIGSGLVLFTCIDFGWQMMQKSLAATAYFSIGCFLAVAFVATLLYIAPVLSRFEGSTFEILRIAFCLPLRNVFSTSLIAILLVVIIFFVDFYPVLLLIAPALYTDLICGTVEKALKKFMDTVKPPQPDNIKTKESTNCIKTAKSPTETALGEQAVENELSWLEQAKLMDASENRQIHNLYATKPSSSKWHEHIANNDIGE